MIEKVFFEKMMPQSVHVIRHLSSYEQTFDVVRTSRSVLIKYLSTQYYFTEIKLSTRALNLLNRLRREALERMKDIELRSREEVRFFAMRKLREGDRLIEYDLQSAYAHAVHELKLCSDETYIELLNLKKQERLAVVGALGTKKIIEKYVAGSVQKRELQVQETEPAWWTICHHVDKTMIEYMHRAGESAAGYWVDALFVRADLQIERPHKRKTVVVVRQLNDSQVLFDDGRIFVNRD